MGVIKGIINLISTFFYSLDIYSDITLALLFFKQGDTFWGILTSVFIIIPLIICNVVGYYGIWRTTKENRKTFGILADKRIGLFCCCTLTLPFVLLLYGVVDGFKGTDNKRVFAGKGLKLMEVFLESLPQCILQNYIVLQVLYGDNATVIVGWWQWTTLAISVANLSFSVATGYYQVGRAAHGEAAVREGSGYEVKPPSAFSQAVFLVLGGLSLVSRFTVCSVLAVLAKPLWAAPFATQLLLAVSKWAVKSDFCCCEGDLNPWPHACDSLTQTGLTGLIILTTTVFNAFTGTGIALGLVSLGYAIGGYFFLPAAMATVGGIAITMASVSCVANVGLVAVPYFRRTIGKDWLIEDDGDTLFY